MEKINYKELKLKCGLEIHQQLNTQKLFCNCPSVLISRQPDFTIKRKLHAVPGESGKIDEAAKYHAGLNKNFIYQGYEDTTCLIELDESPPNQINKNALKIALQISLLLNCKILPVTQIMRKVVIDGSNTGGFQRTILIAKDGYIETNQGRVGIDTICLEEDSARIISSNKKETVYRLDRLGIPLIEIATSPDIKTPEQAKEVALYLGDVLRSCNVKRGLGTIRQDVNMSISKTGRKRIEIKGVQDPNLIIKTINSEIKRQLEKINKNQEIKPQVRKALENGDTDFLRPMPGSARMYPETDLPLLRISRNLINEIKKDLPMLSSDIKKELKKQGLHEELIKLILKEKKLDDFKELLEIRKNSELIAKMLVLYPKEFASKKNISLKEVEKKLHKDILIEIIEALNKNKISENQIKEIMEKILEGSKISDALKIEKYDINLIEEKVMKTIKERPGLNPNAYMGLLMKDLKGKVTPNVLMEIIKKHIK